MWTTSDYCGLQRALCWFTRINRMSTTSFGYCNWVSTLTHKSYLPLQLCHNCRSYIFMMHAQSLPQFNMLSHLPIFSLSQKTYCFQFSFLWSLTIFSDSLLPPRTIPPLHLYTFIFIWIDILMFALLLICFFRVCSQWSSYGVTQQRACVLATCLPKIAKQRWASQSRLDKQSVLL